MTSKITLETIKNNNMIFLSAQPDTTYFHWQVEVYLNNFSSFDIINNCYALFAIKDKPSKELLKLKKKYNIIWYKDERTNTEKAYSPSVYPFLVKKFLKQYPNLGKYIFMHDSDIILRKLPPFEKMLNDDINYLSDTISYIGYNYLIDCSKRYKNKYPKIPENDLFLNMCQAVNINPELVKENQQNSGGAQYFLKNVDYNLFAKIEKTCYILHDFFKKYDKKYNIEHPIQSWCASMWAFLWELWKSGKKTQISKELSFSWGTSSKKEYYQHNILHMAGVTQDKKKGRFCKSDYTNINIINKIKENPNMFKHVKDNASKFYVKEIEHTACGLDGCQKSKSLKFRQLFIIIILILIIFLFVYLWFRNNLD